MEWWFIPSLHVSSPSPEQNKGNCFSVCVQPTIFLLRHIRVFALQGRHVLQLRGLNVCSLQLWNIQQLESGFCMLGVPSWDIQQLCWGLSVQRVALFSRIVRRCWSLLCICMHTVQSRILL